MIPVEGFGGEKIKQVIRAKVNGIDQFIGVMESGKTFELSTGKAYGHIDEFKDEKKS